MTFSNPIWLWGFSGLTIPIAIHFLTRKESKVIQLGSLRHLQDSITNQSVNIRLNELLLLLLRSLLIIVTVLLLAGLSFNNNAGLSQKWLLVEPGVDQAQFRIFIDSLKKQGFISKSLLEGFPELEVTPKNSSDNYWALAEQIGIHHSGQAVVLSLNRMTGFNGKRIPLPQNVTWLASDPDSSNFNLTFNNKRMDSVVIRRASSNTHLTSFNNVKQLPKENSGNVMAVPQVSVIVVSDAKYNYDKDVMLAALYAIDKNSVIPINIKVVSTGEYNVSDSTAWLIWLSDEKTPSRNSHLIHMDITEQMENLPLLSKEEYATKSRWRITGRVNIQTALHDKLVLELSAILFNDAKRLISASNIVDDRRVLPEQLVWSATTPITDKPSAEKTNRAEVAGPLTILMMLLLISERWLSLKRNQ
ncbi:MAG: BatA domain-containing protein [Chryseolinea sp.]